MLIPQKKCCSPPLWRDPCDPLPRERCSIFQIAFFTMKTSLRRVTVLAGTDLWSAVFKTGTYENVTKLR